MQVAKAMLAGSKLTEVACSMWDDGVKQSKYEATGRDTVYRDFELGSVSMMMGYDGTGWTYKDIGTTVSPVVSFWLEQVSDFGNVRGHGTSKSRGGSLKRGRLSIFYLTDEGGSKGRS